MRKNSTSVLRERQKPKKRSNIPFNQKRKGITVAGDECRDIIEKERKLILYCWDCQGKKK